MQEASPPGGTMITEENVWVDELGIDQCWRLLERCSVGRLGFAAEAEQLILPVNYAVDGHSIVVRTGRTVMLEALGPGATVAFEVDGSDAVAGDRVERPASRATPPRWSRQPPRPGRSWCSGRGRRAHETIGCASCPGRSPAGRSAATTGCPTATPCRTCRPTETSASGCARGGLLGRVSRRCCSSVRRSTSASRSVGRASWSASTAAPAHVEQVAEVGLPTS